LATQRRGRSRQDYATPSDFLAAAKRRLGGLSAFTVDFAAHAGNHAAGVWFGPDSPIGIVDALAPGVVWAPYCRGGLESWGWLNPPFDDIAPWAERCAGVRREGGNVALLVPASVGASWFVDHVDNQARVLMLQGRIHFDPDNPKWGYPKDCVLALFSPWLAPGYEVWTWKPTTPRRRERTVRNGDVV
jgi:hypothetical protein